MSLHTLHYAVIRTLGERNATKYYNAVENWTLYRMCVR